MFVIATLTVTYPEVTSDGSSVGGTADRLLWTVSRRRPRSCASIIRPALRQTPAVFNQCHLSSREMESLWMLHVQVVNLRPEITPTAVAIFTSGSSPQEIENLNFRYRLLRLRRLAAIFCWKQDSSWAKRFMTLTCDPI